MAGSLVLGALVTDRVEPGAITAANDLNPFTVLVWCKPTTITANRVIYSKGGGQTRGMRLSGASGDLQFVVFHATTNLGYVTNSAPLALNTWCFVAMVFDDAAGAGLTMKAYQGRVGVPATPCTFSTAVDGVGALTSDAGLPIIWGNNSAFGAAFQGELAFGAVFSGAMSQADIQSWQLEPRQVVGTRAAVECVYFGVDAADALDFAGNANGTVTGATQGAGSGISTPLLQNKALVTALGGNTNAWQFWDRRMCMTSDLQTWSDSILLSGGRAAGIAATQATVGNRPSLNTGVLFGAGKSLLTARDIRLLLSDTTKSLHMLVAVRGTTGIVCAICEDETSQAVYPYAGLEASGGVWKAIYRPTLGASPLDVITEPTSLVAASASVTRGVTFGKNLNSASTHDVAYALQVRGYQPSRHTQNNAADVGTAPGQKFSFNKLSTTGDAELFCCILLGALPTAAMLAAFDTYIQTYHAAVFT